MISAAVKRETSEANRRRYEKLRAEGQEATPKGLPEATALDAMPIAEGAVISREEIPADWYTTVRLRRGEALRIVTYQLRRHCQSAMECRDLEGARHPVGHGAGICVVDRRYQRRA